jgi:hypothetical protein
VKIPMTSIQKQMQHVYAIVRCEADDYPNPDPAARITVKKIVWTEDRAEAEVVRLNALGAEKGVRYFVQMTRLEPPKPNG